MSIEQSGASIHDTANSMHTILSQGERSYDDKVMVIEQSKSLQGAVAVAGAKNAVLVSIAALLLADGVSTLENVPYSSDVIQMVHVLTELGVMVTCDIEQKKLTVDTRNIKNCSVSAMLMKKMRASVLVMGPLLARFGKAEIGLPGGCTIGARPIDYHLKAFAKMNAIIVIEDGLVKAYTLQRLSPARIVFQYPSVGATENVLMAAAATPGQGCRRPRHVGQDGFRFGAW